MSGNNIQSILHETMAADQRGHSTQRRNSIESNLSKITPQKPVVDLVVGMIALPTLIIFALMLETNMQGDWTEAPESRWTVLGIGIGLILISLLVCGYVTHRMGVCLWAGPQDDSDTQSNINREASAVDVFSIGDHLPPSYDTVMQMDYNAPPPAYHCVVLDCETKTSFRIEDETTHHI
ncbi:uncharacterized protein LOC129792224 [Lutzomyia longipalpis]|uniref:Uncharacterized protein n=2 Tax=Lutzomyia longipalpis TaxID=7200 RepID=A0A1B0CI40_LUTLO|nr:uncharacterized protein LOC129792224 [Lutzomyia longipalpis]